MESESDQETEAIDETRSRVSLAFLTQDTVPTSILKTGFSCYFVIEWEGECVVLFLLTTFWTYWPKVLDMNGTESHFRCPHHFS